MSEMLVLKKASNRNMLFPSTRSLEGVNIRDDGKTISEPPMTSEVIPPEAVDVEVPLEALYKVSLHGRTYRHVLYKMVLC